jgi:copper chaperone CopZ
MEREGFTYWPMKSVNLESFETAREALAAVRENPNDRYTLLLSEDARLNYNRALFGVDDPNDLEADNLRDPSDPTASGCAAQALRSIPGVFSARSALAEEFVALRQAVLTSARVKSAEAQWAACMQKQGYTLESPRALRRQMDVELAQNLANAQNLKGLGVTHRKAVQDSAVCVQQSGLDEVVAAAQVDYEKAFVKKHRKFLESFLKTLEQQDLEGE